MRDQRGLILITVMFFVLLVGLFGAAMLTNGPAMARMANQANDELQAQKAAEAGAAYARLQLREDSDWRGDQNTATINLPDLQVVEAEGNVVGWMKNDNGEVSLFRIRFNYQDGGGADGDGLPDPPADLRIDTVFLSLNNVRNSQDSIVPAVNPSNFRVDDPESGEISAPRGTAFLRIEGLAGPALRQVQGPRDPIGQGQLSRRTLRAIYAASAHPSIPDSALSAGNGILLELENGADVLAIGAADAKLRSKRGVSVKSPSDSLKPLNLDGEVGRDPLYGIEADMSSSVTESNESIGDGRDFHNLSWDQVPQASTSPSDAIQLPCGIYICDISGQFHYYDMSLDDYKALTPDPANGNVRPGGVPLSSNFSELRGSDLALGGLEVTTPGSESYKTNLTITQDLRFNPSAEGQHNVVFSNLSGRELYQNEGGEYLLGGVDPITGLFAPPAGMKITNAVISVPSDMAILVDLEGENASLTIEGNAVVAAPSIKLEVDQGLSVGSIDQRLSIYTKEDLQVSTYIDLPEFTIDLGMWGGYFHLPAYQGYGSLNLQGLIYAWGDANIYAGTPGQTYSAGQFGMETNYGEVNIEGALVAYGADPGEFEAHNPTTGPGSDDRGLIGVHAMRAEIIYDPTKLVADPNSLPEAGIPALIRISYGFES